MKKTAPGQRARWVNRLNLIAAHELSALRAHLNATAVRYRLARRARGAGELLRDQFDLTAESMNRLRRDQQDRRELWRGVISNTAAARR